MKIWFTLCQYHIVWHLLEFLLFSVLKPLKTVERCWPSLFFSSHKRDSMKIHSVTNGNLLSYTWRRTGKLSSASFFCCTFFFIGTWWFKKYFWFTWNFLNTLKNVNILWKWYLLESRLFKSNNFPKFRIFRLRDLANMETLTALNRLYIGLNRLQVSLQIFYRSMCVGTMTSHYVMETTYRSCVFCNFCCISFDICVWIISSFGFWSFVLFFFYLFWNSGLIFSLLILFSK